MSASELLQRLRSIPPDAELDFTSIRQEILDQYETATTTNDRVLCLSMFKTVMDTVERHLEQHGKATATQIAEFKEARRIDYHSLITQEALVGENICVETLDAVTQREIAAGRMAPNNSLRKIAVDGLAAPHLTHAELVSVEAEKQGRPTLSKEPPLSWWRRALNWILRP